jgi:hypothetical protein
VGKGNESGKENNIVAEIKSTLDIVLERTKNLIMTEEEKASLQRKELAGKITGWLGKYLDGLMDMEAIRKEMTSMEEKSRKNSRHILKSLVLDRLDPREDAEKILDLLEGILGESREPYLDAMGKLKNTMVAERSQFAESLRRELSDRGIAGSAVTPNLARDEKRRLFQENALAEFRKGIALIGRDN